MFKLHCPFTDYQFMMIICLHCRRLISPHPNQSAWTTPDLDSQLWWMVPQSHTIILNWCSAQLILLIKMPFVKVTSAFAAPKMCLDSVFDLYMKSIIIHNKQNITCWSVCMQGYKLSYLHSLLVRYALWYQQLRIYKIGIQLHGIAISNPGQVRMTKCDDIVVKTRTNCPSNN